MANIISILSLIIALTVHEFAHAFTADRLGDPTPRSLGRLSLNPLRHLDPLGTLMLLFAHFGWGKPVPIDPYNFKNPRRDELLVSLAGPGSNLILAIALSLIIRLSLFQVLNSIFYILVVINISLAVFNLLPIPPLDGSKIFLNLLPENQSSEWQLAFEKYGSYILILLLFLPFGGSNLVGILISPVIKLFLSLLLS